MTTSRLRRFAAAALAVALSCWNVPVLRAQEPERPRASTDADAATAGRGAAVTLTGRLVSLDRATPWVGRQVRVVDARSGRSRAVVTSDEAGRFALPALEPGAYHVLVGAAAATLTIAEGTALREIVLVLARAVVDAEPPIPMADGTLRVDAGLGASNLFIMILGPTVLVVGAGVAAGAITYNAGDIRDGSRNVVPVSPSSP